MNGDRNMPTRMLIPRLNQLELTFLRISILRIRKSVLAVGSLFSSGVRSGGKTRVHVPGNALQLRGLGAPGSPNGLGDGHRHNLVSQARHQIAPGILNLLHTVAGKSGTPSSGFGDADKGNVF